MSSSSLPMAQSSPRVAELGGASAIVCPQRSSRLPADDAGRVRHLVMSLDPSARCSHRAEVRAVRSPTMRRLHKDPGRVTQLVRELERRKSNPATPVLTRRLCDSNTDAVAYTSDTGVGAPACDIMTQIVLEKYAKQGQELIKRGDDADMMSDKADHADAEMIVELNCEDSPRMSKIRTDVGSNPPPDPIKPAAVKRRSSLRRFGASLLHWVASVGVGMEVMVESLPPGEIPSSLLV